MTTRGSSGSARRRPIAGERRGRSESAPAPASVAETPEEVEAQVAADIAAPQSPSPGEAQSPGGPQVLIVAPAEKAWGRPLVVVLAALCVVAVAAFAVLAFRALRADGVDAARSEGVAAAREAAAVVLSYDHRHLDRDFRAAEQRLTGAFAGEYASTTDSVVRPTATATKAVVKASVQAASVVSATPDRVVTLLFVNQTTTSTRVEEPRTDLNRVRMTMDKVDGRWLVSDVDAL